eukprot:1158392-Pelagomonas_calceolata.AAC.8
MLAPPGDLQKAAGEGRQRSEPQMRGGYFHTNVTLHVEMMGWCQGCDSAQPVEVGSQKHEGGPRRPRPTTGLPAPESVHGGQRKCLGKGGPTHKEGTPNFHRGGAHRYAGAKMLPMSMQARQHGRAGHGEACPSHEEQKPHPFCRQGAAAAH